MFPWPVRVLGIFLAAVQLVLLSMTALGFEYSVPFEDFMTWLGDRIASALQLDAIEATIRDFLASIGFHLPELGKHWHHVFVLMWLLLGSLARYGTSMDTVDAPLLSGSWFRNAAIVFGWLAWAAVCALASAVATGTTVVNTALVAWPMVGLTVFMAGIFLPGALRGRVPWSAIAQVLAVAAGVAFFAYMASRPMNETGGIVTDSRALRMLVVGVGLFGLIIGAVGLLRGSMWRERLTNPATAFGMDVIGAYAIAFTLAAIFGKYTLG